MSLKP